MPLAALRPRNRVLILFFTTCDAATPANFSRSSASPSSIGEVSPPSTACMIASGAGSKPGFLRRILAHIQSKTSWPSLDCGTGPGRTNPSRSHGWSAGAAPERIRSLALARTSASGTISSTKPISSALAAVTWRSSTMIGRAAARPTRRGKRCVPPAPGMSPRETSGRPSLRRGSSAAMRYVQDNAISRPPPNASPLIAATNGFGANSMSRMQICTPSMIAVASEGVLRACNSLRSPPTRNDFLADAMTTPLTVSSATRSRTML